MNEQIEIRQRRFSKNSDAKCSRALTRRFFAIALLSIAWLALSAPAINGQELNSSKLRLQLGVSAEGIPVIKDASWTASGLPVFRDAGTGDGLESWVPQQFIPSTSDTEAMPQWEVTEYADFIRAKASRTLLKGLVITWIVELPKDGGLFRLYVRMKNAGNNAQAVEWFPAWAASWNLANSADWVRAWKSLTFERIEKSLRPGKKLELGSRLHSSQENDENPYWTVGGNTERVHFGLEWCGGWRAKIKRSDGGVTFSAWLPPEETQLVLKAGQGISGPVLIVMPTSEADEILHRRLWMDERQALGRLLYGGPDRFFPLAYNHWYSVRRKVTDQFLSQQAERMAAYGFDAFVVDAGWYDDAGDWNPNQGKFEAGEFETLMASLKAKGLKTGLWSSPQFVNADEDGTLPEDAEMPIAHSTFLDAYLLNLAASDFKDHLLDHVSMLRERYSIDWWKFDSTLFVQNTSAGVMKNVVAYQNSMRALRRAQPDLFIESCQGGGRMINELTLLACQAQWLRDGGEKGEFHARQNIETVLGALDFVFPSMAYSWSNRIDEMNQNNDEMTRYYCRSSMAGTWGISADLSKIGSRQQNIILEEIQRYRELNQIKQYNLYDLELPKKKSNAAGVTFYDATRAKAGTLLYRWDGKGAFDHRAIFKNLQAEPLYRVRDADRNHEITMPGAQLVEEGFVVPFDSERMSALIFVELAR